MRKNRIILCCIAIILCSCVSKVSKYEDFLNEQLNENYSSLISKYSQIVIIPRSGCHSCVEKADAFFEENKSNENMLFIFTRLVSKKQLRIEFGATNLSLPNVIVDENNIFYSLDFEDSEYPLLLKKSGSDLYQYEHLNPMISY